MQETHNIILLFAFTRITFLWEHSNSHLGSSIKLESKKGSIPIILFELNWNERNGLTLSESRKNILTVHPTYQLILNNAEIKKLFV